MCYNCNNLSCNSVFISCRECACSMSGCCSVACSQESGKHFVPRNSRQWAWGTKKEGGGLSKMVGRGRHYRDLVTHIRKANAD